MSILDPTKQAEVPDISISKSIPKSVEGSLNLTVQTPGAFLIVHTPHNLRSYGRLYVRVPSAGRYVFKQELFYNQLLSNDFTIGRYVSAGLCAKATGVPIGIFQQSGTINASAYQQLPDLDTLTFNEVTSYKRESAASVSEIPVGDGVYTIGLPDDDFEFEVLDNPNSLPKSTVLRTIARKTLSNPDGFNAGNIIWGPSGVTLFDSSSTDLIPSGLFGKTRLSGMLRFQSLATTTAGGKTVINLIVAFEEADANWTGVIGSTKTLPITFAVVAFSAANTTGQINTVPFEFFIDDPRPITAIFLASTATGPDLAGTYTISNDTEIALENWNYYDKRTYGPGSLIAVEGMAAGQIFSLSSTLNVEVVPDAELSKNIVTQDARWFHPFEMEMVSKFLAHSSANGVNIIWSLPDYKFFIRGGSAQNMSQMENLAQASGFTDWIKKMFNWIKPIARAVAPVLGTALGGPAGGMIGQGISNLFEDTNVGQASAYKQQRFASLLGSPEWEAAAAEELTRYSDWLVNPNMDDLEAFEMNDPLLYPQTADVLLSRNAIMSCAAEAVPLACMLFPVIDDDKPLESEIAQVMVTNQLLVIPGYQATRIFYQDATVSLSFFSVKPSTLWVKELYKLTCCMIQSYAEAGVGVFGGSARRQVHVSLICKKPFSGFSFTAALCAALHGCSSKIPMTGGFLNNKAYMPNMVAQKSNLARTIGRPLAIVATKVDLMSFVEADAKERLTSILIKQDHGYYLTPERTVAPTIVLSTLNQIILFTTLKIPHTFDVREDVEVKETQDNTSYIVSKRANEGKAIKAPAAPMTRMTYLAWEKKLGREGLIEIEGESKDLNGWYDLLQEKGEPLNAKMRPEYRAILNLIPLEFNGELVESQFATKKTKLQNRLKAFILAGYKVKEDKAPAMKGPPKRAMKRVKFIAPKSQEIEQEEFL